MTLGGAGWGTNPDGFDKPPGYLEVTDSFVNLLEWLGVLGEVSILMG